MSPFKLAATLLFALLHLSHASQAQTLRWAARADILTTDPHSEVIAFTNYVNAQVYESLITRDKDLNIIPCLSTEWTQVTPLLWRFKLRPGVKFHDGTPFTADDVVFSVKRAQQPTANQRTFAAPMGEPRKVDDLTVEFTLQQFNPIFLVHATQIFMMSKIWAEKNNATTTPDFKAKEVKFTLFNANGTGPYSLVSRQPDSKTVYKRNPNWWGKFDGNVQEVVFTPIGNDATRTAALISGEVDFIYDPSPQDVPRLRGNPATRILDQAGNLSSHIGMDQNRDELLYSNVKGKNPFKDLRVRRALYHAMDIETLRSGVLGGLTYPTGSITHSSRASFNDPEIEKRLPFDLPKARTLMAEAGYAQGFEVTLDCPNSSAMAASICTSLATMWSQIGVKVRANLMPVPLFYGKTEKLDTSLYLFGWAGASTDVEPQLTSLLRQRGPGGVGHFNWGNYKNQKLEDLAVASFKETDEPKREQLIKAALLEHNDQVNHIPMHRVGIPWAMRSNVTAIHRADNRMEWRWINVAPKP